MASIRLAHHLIKSKVKMRYAILSILFTIMIFIIPYYYPYDSNYSPISSFSNKNEFGHSIVRNQLATDYDVKQNNLWFDNSINPKDNLILIVSPQKSFLDSEIKYLRNWIKNGGYIILGGNSVETLDLAINFDIFSFGSGTNLVDFQTPYDNPNFIDITMGNNKSKFVSVAPIPLDLSFTTQYDYKISTTQITETKSCVIYTGSGCEQFYDIGVSMGQIAVFLDNWLISNRFINKFPQNKLFLDAIINRFKTKINTIFVDESHYNWAPLNRKGVEVTIDRARKANFYIPFILFISFLIPLFLANLSGVFKKDRDKLQDTITSRLSERVDRLYLDRIIAIPLSLEEQVLIDEKLEMISRGKFYFQHVAKYYLDEIEKLKLIDYIPQFVINSLLRMEKEVINKNISWKIIKSVNYYIKQALTEKEEKKTYYNLSYNKQITAR